MRRMIVEHAAAMVNAGQAADLGCGPGYLAVALAKGILVIFGPSATGKTLTVRAMAGLRPATGTIRVGGETLLDSEAQRNVAPEHRRVGYVPQHVALFPHLNVRDNVAFGLRARGNGNGWRGRISLQSVHG